MKTGIRKSVWLLTIALPLLFGGCGNNELKPVTSGKPELPAAVEHIVPVRSGGGAAGEAEFLLVPQSAIVRRGELTGVLVVGADDRLSLRWIRTGRLMQSDVVVLGGLDKGEFIVGTYDPALHEGVTVKKSPRVTEEDHSK